MELKGQKQDQVLVCYQLRTGHGFDADSVVDEQEAAK